MESRSQGNTHAELVRVGDVVVDKYVVTRVLGRGGMGLVVAACQRGINVPVALKLLLPSVRDRPGMSERFDQEARTGARLTNHHVARVSDVGTWEGTPFIVMEYLEGQDLAARIADEGPLPVNETVDLLMQVCEAIAEAHALGIVHRDLKPSNLFLTTATDGTPFVKVLDFGISKVTAEGDAAMTGSAGTGVLGSLLYMSPEQLISAKSVDPRADVWALGVILYEMLAGVAPFGGEAFSEICSAIQAGTFEPLSARREGVPRELDAVVSDALAAKRELRLSSVKAFAERLAPFGTEAARESLARVRGTVAHAAGASRRPAVAETGAPASPGARPRRATGSDEFSQPGVARSEAPSAPRRLRRWAAAGLGVAAAATGALLFAVMHNSRPSAVAASPVVEAKAMGVAVVDSGAMVAAAASAALPPLSPITCATGAVDICEAECAAKNWGSCYKLAKLLDKGESVPKDFPRAVTLYQSACTGEVFAACNELGTIYAKGDGVPRDELKAVSLYKRACDGGYALGCQNLGAMHFEGRGLQKDEAAGVNQFSRACEGGDATGCLNMGVAYAEGRGAPKNLDQAFKYAKRACDGGLARGCARVGRATIAGEGVAKDVKGGLAQLDALCDRGKTEGCEELRKLYGGGLGADVPVDQAQARVYAKKGCDLGAQTECAIAKAHGELDRVATGAALGNAMFQKGCDTGDITSCGMLGLDLIDGKGIAKDPVKGKELLERACKAKVPRTCERLAKEEGQ